ncbi:PREDICTED: LOW QUALITY PROTEIN: CASP-like protein 1D1 [Prunus mume]|uniref:CASP-like protein n=1 Tax=Prunus mume TaxID=102107 RepID=A0ABM1LI97_PRUMU|nr:PREDICTED: LOW QUALITY PROTEIN: CASP-like protein 1D1 [Prunus mume]
MSSIACKLHVNNLITSSLWFWFIVPVPDSFNLNAAVCLLHRDVQLTTENHKPADPILVESIARDFHIHSDTDYVRPQFKFCTEPSKSQGWPCKRPVIYFCFSLLLRSLLIAASVVGVVFMLTSKQSEDWYYEKGNYYATISFKFTQSPAFIYYVAALSVAGVYATITTFTSFLDILAPASSAILVPFALFDVLILGIIASATGTAGSVAYILLRGNDDFSWSDFYYAYSSFCRHLGVSFGVSIFASILLILLLWTSIITLYKTISKQTYSRDVRALAARGPRGRLGGGANPKCGFQQQEAARASSGAHIPGLAQAPARRLC